MAYQYNQGDRPLPGYTIDRGVGRGGFGEVYYATSDGGKEVALKYLRENPQIELRGVTHCLNLKSPYLVSLHDIRQNGDGDHFVIMEYVSGPSLREVMSAEPKGLGPQKAAYFLRELAKGLAYLHDRGIVHRDLKPGNIFYEDGYVKIGDYGLAKMMTASQHSGQTVSVGTVHYMAPEVGSGVYDRTIDIYALGVILYEMLLGRVPFSGATMGEVLMKHLTAQPEVDELPEPFAKVIRKALAKDPKDRYQTVNEMLSEVFAVEDLDKSVTAFQPASLSTLAARVAGQAKLVQAATQAAGPAGVPGVMGTGSSNVGQGVAPPVVHPEQVAAGPTGRFEQFHDRISARVGQVAGRIDESPIGRRVSEAAQRPSHWAEKILVALLILGGFSFGTGLLAEDGDPWYTVTVFLHMLVMVTGIIAGGWFSLDRLRVEGKWLPRFVIAACAGAALVPVRLFADYALDVSQVNLWVVPLLLSLIACDWVGRFREGQRGKVCLGSAFSAGLFGFIAGLIFSGGNGFAPAAIVAAGSLALQSLAGLWPVAAGARGAGADDASPERLMGGRAGLVPPPVPAGVAVEVGGSAPWEGQTAAAVAAVAVGTAVDRPRRSGAIRALWLFVSALLMLTTAMVFIAAGVLDFSNQSGNGDFGYYIAGGIVAANGFLFALWCALPRFKKGLWRGVFRKAIFLGGTALSGSTGAAIGLFGLENDDLLIALGCIIAGGIASLFVWFVPMPAYNPVRVPVDEEELTPRQRGGRRLMKVGGILLGGTLCVLVTLLATLHEYDYDDVIPPVISPLAAFSLTILVVGYYKTRPKQPKPPELGLPLRSVFDVEANPKLSQLIERHFSVLGYALSSRSDQLWSFARGNWAHQFFQKEIRRWPVRASVAAYELDHGGYRLSCYVDVDAPFSTPTQRMMAVLQDELRDLKELLGGRDVPTDSREAQA